jgi:hypothetical protein
VNKVVNVPTNKSWKPYCISGLWQWAKGSGLNITATTGNPTPTHPLGIAPVNNYPVTWTHYRARRYAQWRFFSPTEPTTRKVAIYSHSCPCLYTTWRRKKVEVQLHAFPFGTKWRRVARFTPTGEATGTHWIGGWVNPTAGLDPVKRRICYRCQESNPSSLRRLSEPPAGLDPVKRRIFYRCQESNPSSLIAQPPDNSYTSPPEQLLTKLSFLLQYEVMMLRLQAFTMHTFVSTLMMKTERPPKRWFVTQFLSDAAPDEFQVATAWFSRFQSIQIKPKLVLQSSAKS